MEAWAGSSSGKFIIATRSLHGAKRNSGIPLRANPDFAHALSALRLLNLCRKGFPPMKPETAGPAPQADEHTQGRGSRLKERAVEEFRRFVVLFLYLWLMFGLFALQERIVLKEQGINFTAQGFALVNALVLAKVMLVAENLNFGRWLNRRPLIYPILHDAFLFAVLFIVFHVVESLVIGLVHGEAVRASIPLIGGGGLAGLLCVAVILFAALIPYFAVKNLNLALGPGRLKELLFEVRVGTVDGEAREK